MNKVTSFGLFFLVAFILLGATADKMPATGLALTAVALAIGLGVWITSIAAD